MEHLDRTLRRTPNLTVVAASLLAGVVASATGQTCRWVQVGGGGPSNRYGHAMAYDTQHSEVVLFGGSFDHNPLHDDTWVWRSGAGWTQVNLIGDRPGGRRRHAMAYDSRRGVVVLFGGLVSNSGPSAGDDTWEWDGATWTQREIPGPSPRMDVAMTFDDARGVIVLFGGRNDDPREVYGDTWEYDGEAWQLRSSGGPSPRAVPGNPMAFDSARGVCVMFGGETSAGVPYQDTWTWNGEVWQFKGDNGPEARSNTALAFDQGIEKVVMFGGDGSEPGYLDDTWCWDGERWMQINIGGPAARAGHAMAYDGRAGECILFGGADNSSASLGDTWALRCQDIELLADGTCPRGGPIRIEWSGATPSGQVALIFATCEGNFIVPPRNPCQGTQLGLGACQIRVAWIGRSDGTGSRVLNSTAGNGACGKFLQLLDLSTCDTSNVAQIE